MANLAKNASAQDSDADGTNAFEYRLIWSASTNINFHGMTDWLPWGGFEDTVTDVYEAINGDNSGVLPQALEEVLEASGFDWFSEVREVDA